MALFYGELIQKSALKHKAISHQHPMRTKPFKRRALEKGV
ncbi:hypothetical protein N403_02420 [Helicobacter pylori FD430]|nr:hypothetical protein N403_02420 [Helicobacter pylori FD430]